MSELETPKVEKSNDMGTIILMLGLYLIVLAFFILLNSISEDSEEKIKKATESVKSGFGFQSASTAKMMDNVTITLDPVFDVIAREIEAVIDSYISVKDYRLINKENKMVLRISSDRMFIPGKIRINPSMADLFDDLSDLINKPKPGTKAVITVSVHNNQKDVIDDKYDALELSGRRAALFSRALIERGIDPKNVSAGALVKFPSEVQIVFDIMIIDQKLAEKEVEKILDKNKQQSIEADTKAQAQAQAVDNSPIAEENAAQAENAISPAEQPQDKQASEKQQEATPQ